MDHEGWKPTNELTLTLLNTADCDWLACPADSTPQKAGAPSSHEFPGGVAFQLDLPSSTLPSDKEEAAGSVINEKMDVKILNGTGWEAIAPGSQQAEKRWTIRTKPSDKPVIVLGTQENAQLRISITGLRALREGQTYLGVRCTQGGKFAPWSVKLPLLKRKYYETATGTILMWSGDPQQVPKGWQLCDGSQMANGKKAPDLRERFVCGAGPASAHMKAGDYTKVKFAGETSPVEGHTHTVMLRQREKDSGFGARDFVLLGGLGGDITSYETTPSPTHNHTFDLGQLPEIRPKWFALAFIIKTGDY